MARMGRKRYKRATYTTRLNESRGPEMPGPEMPGPEMRVDPKCVLAADDKAYSGGRVRLSPFHVFVSPQHWFVL